MWWFIMFLPVRAQEKERSPSSWWRVWRQSVAVAAPRERWAKDSDWLTRSAMRPIPRCLIDWLCWRANWKYTQRWRRHWWEHFRRTSETKCSRILTKLSRTYVVLKSAQLLLAEDVEEEGCPGAGGGVVIGCWAEVGVAEAVARRLIGASLSGIRSA